MALPTSGALSLGAIQTEFGGSNPISASEYYAGGSYVPSSTSGTNGAVPSSGALAFSKFYGTSKAVVNISNYTLDWIQSYAASSGYRLSSDGKVYWTYNTGTGGLDLLESWVVPNAAASDYEAYVSVTTGSVGGSATGSWLSLGSNREWNVLTSSYPETVSAVISVQIRKIGTTTVLDTATITLSASSIDPGF